MFMTREKALSEIDLIKFKINKLQILQQEISCKFRTRKITFLKKQILKLQSEELYKREELRKSIFVAKCKEQGIDSETGNKSRFDGYHDRFAPNSIGEPTWIGTYNARNQMVDKPNPRPEPYYSVTY
jgi:hypothetical protein